MANSMAGGARFLPALATMRASIGADALASVVVFLVALPLCMGVAIASGLPPTAGLITGIVGGIVVGALSGAPLLVSGPAAGLTVLIWQLVQQFGVGTLGAIVLLAGAMQVGAGMLKLGQWFRAVSPAVIHGMLAGIGVLIMASQFHVMIDNKPVGSGLENLLAIPGSFIEALYTNAEGIEAFDIGVLTIAVLVLWSGFAPKRLKVVPAPLVAVVVATIAAAATHLHIHHVSLPDNIWAEVQLPALADLARAVVDPSLLMAAASIAFIASAETLLAATAVDQMHQGPRTKYDKELVAQGVGNTLCGFLGALPMTGVIVRSSANVQAGAKTRASAILHGVWLLVFVSALPFVLELVPVASLAAVLVYTGFKLAYPKAVIRELLKYGRTEVAIYVVTVGVIVCSNLLEGVLVGLALSILKLLYAFSHLDVGVEEDEARARVDLHLTGAATLVRLPKLASALETIPAGREVHVHFGELDYIDHACLDLLANWETQHRSTGGALVMEWDELSQKYHQRHQRQPVRTPPGEPAAALPSNRPALAMTSS